MDGLDREFNLLAASVKRTACVQQDEVRRFLDTAPRSWVTSRQAPGDLFESPRQGSQPVAADGETAPAMETSTGDSDPRRGFVLARRLHAAYGALIEHVERRIEDYKTLPDKQSKGGAVMEMRQLVSGARGLHRSLSWLDAAGNPPLDLGTRYLVDQIAARLVLGGAEVTVVAAIDRSYATVTNPLQQVFELSDARPPVDEVAIVVFVPRREQRSGLLHPLIVHELAHAANKQHDLVARVLDTAHGNNKLMNKMNKAAKKQAEEDVDTDVSDDDISAAAEIIGARLAAWVEEAVCDAFAVQLLGPAYLYSFMAIVGTSDLDSASEEHPPTRQRIGLLLNQLEELGWNDLLADTSSEIDGWFRQTAREEHHHAEVGVRFCVDALASLEREIRIVVATHVDKMVFQASDFMPLQVEISQLLDAGIPPSQTLERKAIPRAAIILGSWLFAVKVQGGDLDALATAADVPELSRLLPKALQDAALLEAWEDR